MDDIAFGKSGKRAGAHFGDSEIDAILTGRAAANHFLASFEKIHAHFRKTMAAEDHKLEV